MKQVLDKISKNLYTKINNRFIDNVYIITDILLRIRNGDKCPHFLC